MSVCAGRVAGAASSALDMVMCCALVLDTSSSRHNLLCWRPPSKGVLVRVVVWWSGVRGFWVVGCGLLLCVLDLCRFVALLLCCLGWWPPLEVKLNKIRRGVEALASIYETENEHSSILVDFHPMRIVLLVPVFLRYTTRSQLTTFHVLYQTTSDSVENIETGHNT